MLSRERDRAATFAEKHGARAPVSVFTDLDGMLGDRDLDAVVIATPDRLHAVQAIAALEAGKHVLVEKPMATSVAEADAMVAAASAAKRVLAVAYHLRWHAGHRALAGRIAAGELGTVRHARLQWSWQARDASNWRAREEVGRWWALAGVGTHLVDLARWLVGAKGGGGEVVDVASVTASPRHRGPHDESAVVALRFASGATAELFASVLVTSPRRVEIYGDTAAAICDGTLGPHGTGTITVGDVPLRFEPVDPYAGEIADFVRAIREHGAPEVDGVEGRANVGVLERACP